jgi:hypothetical protein
MTRRDTRLEANQAALGRIDQPSLSTLEADLRHVDATGEERRAPAQAGERTNGRTE